MNDDSAKPPISGQGAADRRTAIATAVALLEERDWQAAHRVVQQYEDSALACWAHGIVHLMEGDLSNARYWYVRAGRELPQRPHAATELSALKTAMMRG